MTSITEVETLDLCSNPNVETRATLGAISVGALARGGGGRWGGVH